MSDAKTIVVHARMERQNGWNSDIDLRAIPVGVGVDDCSNVGEHRAADIWLPFVACWWWGWAEADS